MSAEADPPEIEPPSLGAGGLYIALVSVHGRIRGHDLELGSEPDTGGQVLYVVELARALALQPEVERVELFTRRIVDPEVSADYAEWTEELGPGAKIVRISAGPDEYIRKEELWDHLDSFADNMLEYLHSQDRLPDVIHSHYADAGYVGIRVANHCGCPLVHTGHSLGRSKRRRLLASGQTQAQIEERYFISRRIEAEEDTLAAADLVITSTRQEVEEQYEQYDHYRPFSMRVVPPGLDLDRFKPTGPEEETAHLEKELSRFLQNPELPIVLAIARPDERKNLTILVRTFGEFEGLRKAANLVIIAGTRDDVRAQEEGVRGVITNLLLAIDAYDIYGSVAVPKHHRPEDVPLYYRLAARSGGVFVNPALTEPFGLTLLESAASGLPIVATEDGGPTEIVGNCNNGELIDPLDANGIAKALLGIISNEDRWKQLSGQGIKGVREQYSWSAHAYNYLRAVRRLPKSKPPTADPEVRPRAPLYTDRALFTDIDKNLLGEPEAIGRLGDVIRQNRSGLAFGLATCRTLKRAIQFLRQETQLPRPDVLITGLGTDIHYAPKLVNDTAWRDHINHLWNPWAIHRLLDELPGLSLQPKIDQSFFKISYDIDPRLAPELKEIIRMLRGDEQAANVFLSFGRSLDIVPVRASKGAAMRYVATQWSIPVERILAAGGSGADEDMMRGNTLAVVVANRHQEELSQLDDVEGIYFAERPFADGILEAIDYYDFFGRCGVPEE